MKVNRPIRPKQKKTPRPSSRRSSEQTPEVNADVEAETANKPTPIAGTTNKLHKVLAQKGLGSRREMEALIASGQVTINREVASVGDRVGPTDVVRIGKRIIRLRMDGPTTKVILYHKPEGEIVSHSDPQGRPSVFDKLPHLDSSKWIAIGRLDFNTSGLLIFTTDGELANRLMHPRFEVEREYAVRVIGELTSDQMKLLTTGVELKDGIANFTYLSDQGGEGTNHWYRVILKEGKNREVRRMFEAIGLTVSRLMRVRFGPVNLPPRIKRGQWIELDEKEIKRLLKLIK